MHSTTKKYNDFVNMFKDFKIYKNKGNTWYNEGTNKKSQQRNGNYKNETNGNSWAERYNKSIKNSPDEFSKKLLHCWEKRISEFEDE